MEVDYWVIILSQSHETELNLAQIFFIRERKGKGQPLVSVALC